MTLQAACDAWIADLATVTGLTTAEQHKYASWSQEQLVADGARHLAVWPDAATETAQPMLAGSPPSHLVTQLYTILVWENAASESTRLYDDDTANAAWLALYEAIVARLYVLANMAGPTAKAGAGTNGRFLSVRNGLAGTVRFIEVRFGVDVVRTFT